MPGLSKTARRHDHRFQQSRFRQSLNKPYHRFCKDVGLHRVPICQFYYLGCAVLKVKPQLTPFTVVVRLIQVDSGGYFLFLLRHSVCFSVTVWTTLLSSSFSRNLSSVRRWNLSAPLAVVPSKSTAKSSKLDCVAKGLTRPQVMQMAFRFSRYHCSL